MKYFDDDADDNDELFCGLVDRRNTFSLISSLDHCQRSSPSLIFDTLWAGIDQEFRLGCAVVITNTPQRRCSQYNPVKICLNLFHTFSNMNILSWILLFAGHHVEENYLIKLLVNVLERDPKCKHITHIGSWSALHFLLTYCSRFVLKGCVRYIFASFFF